MFNFVTNIFGNIFTRHSSSFLSSMLVMSYLWTWIKNLFMRLINFVVGLMWAIIRWVLGVIEAFEYIINSMLGLDMTLDDYKNYAIDSVEGTTEVNAAGETVTVTFLDSLVKVFKAMIGVAIVFLIIFTIVAIIRQEFANAEAGFEKKSKDGKGGVGNDKSGIMAKLFKNLIYIIVLPLSMIFVIVGVNSVLSAFSNALGAAKGTVAGQVLAASTYDANRYRMYASAGKRVPIVISAYDTSNYAPDNALSYSFQIKSVSVQSKLKATATNFANDSFLEFNRTLSYQNNKISNSADYGSYYEQFVCTAEQYQVMADFIDYAELSNLKYCIKSMDDPDISWKYVDKVVFDPEAEEKTLTINYRDASDLNGNGKTSDTYTMVYAPSNEVTSPISDALNSIMAMLGAGNYSDNVYNTMERDDSGNFVNLVQWANEKVKIILSNGFTLNNFSTWSKADQVIIYELNHFSSNNTFGDTKLEDLIPSTGKGIELDVKQIAYKEYYPEADAYSSEKTINCVYINGNYYPVKQSTDYADNFGNPYYELDVPDDVDYLKSECSVLKKDGQTQLKLTSGFQLNNPNTWTTNDQIIVYEYYKDLSYNNTLSAYTFSDFSSGVTIDTYKITGANEGTYVLLNGTFYQTSGFTTTGTGEFLKTLSDTSKTYYDFTLQISSTDVQNTEYFEFVGADKLINLNTSGTVIMPSGDLIEAGVSLYFSKDFNVKDITTWTYKDYFIFYLFMRYGVASSLDEILYCGVQGNIYLVNSQPAFVPSKSNQINLSISMKYVNAISDLNISTSLNVEEIIEQNIVDTSTDKLFVSYDELSSIHFNSAESKQFLLSNDFDYYDVSTWTVLDLIIAYLSSCEVIGDLDTIKIYGYNAIKYSSDTEGIVYRFGSNGGTGTVYLSEKNVLAMTDSNGNRLYTSIDTFLRINAYTFLCQYLNLSENNLISTKQNLVNDIFTNYDSYILDSKTLASTLISENFGTLISSITEYTYQNKNFEIGNFSTWTNLDLAIYCLTGSASGIYKSNVVKYSDDKYYFIIGDKAIDISTGSAFESTTSAVTINKNSSETIADLKIESEAVTVSISSAEELKEYFNTLTNPEGSNYIVKTTPGTVSLSSGLKYKYTAGLSIDKNNITSEITTANILDLIIAYASSDGVVKAGEDYTFYVYSDSSFDYIKFNGYYIEVYDESKIEDTSKQLTFKKATMKLNTSVSDMLTFDSTYTSMTSDITYLDAIIYQYTQSVSSDSYGIYVINGLKYVNIEGNIVQVEYTFTRDDGDDATDDTVVVNFADDIDETTFKDLSYTVPDGEVTSTSCDQVSYLYRNYYNNYVISNISSYDKVFTNVSYDNTGFSISNTGTWNPLAIILYQLGVTDVRNGKIYTKGDKKYLYFSSNVNSVQQTYYIDVSEFLLSTGLDQGTGASNVITSGIITSSSIKEMLLRLYFVTNLYGIPNLSVNGKIIDTEIKAIYNYEESGTKLTAEEILLMYQSLNSSFDTLIEDDDSNTLNSRGTIKELDDIKQTYSSSMNLSDATTWTWFDLLYYNHTNSTLSGTTYEYLTYVSNDELYAEIASDDDGKIYAIANSAHLKLFENFVHSGTENVVYSDSTGATDSSSILSLIYYKISGSKTGEVKTFTYTTSLATAEPFYLIYQASTGVNYGVYRLPSSVEEVQFSIENNNITYITSVSENVDEWTLFDFIVFYARAHTEKTVILSNIYTYNSKAYYLIGDNYIDIKALGYDCDLSADRDFVNLSGATLLSTQDLKLGKILGLTGEVYDTDAMDFVIATETINLQEGALGPKIKTIISDFYTGNDTIGYGEETFSPEKSAHIISKVVDNNNATFISFSQGFIASDYSTWTLSDIMIYYAIINDYYTGDENLGFTFTANVPTKVVNGVTSYAEQTKSYYQDIFQSYVINGGVPAYVYNLVNEDSNGNAQVFKVINLSNNLKNPSAIYLNYDVFEALKSRTPSNLVLNDTNFIELKISETELTNTSLNHFTYAMETDNNFVDFVYSNYYFFNLDEEKFDLYGLTSGISSTLKTAILTGEAYICGTVNLSLTNKEVDILTGNITSTKININNVGSWNLLQLIAIYEYSRPIANNVFKDMAFEDLYSDNYMLLYSLRSDSNEKILFINGNFYNLTNYLTKNRAEESDKEYRLKTEFYATAGNSNSILDLVDERFSLINQAINNCVDFSRTLVNNTKIVQEAVSTGTRESLLSAYETVKTFDGYTEIFIKEVQGQIDEYIETLENESCTPNQLNATKNFMAGTITLSISTYARNQVRDYIKDTLDSNGNYLYSSISSDEILDKLISIFTSLDNFKEEVAVDPDDPDAGTISVLFADTDRIDSDFIKGLDAYAELCTKVRKQVVEAERVSNYTVSQLKQIIEDELERAFDEAGCVDGVIDTADRAAVIIEKLRDSYNDGKSDLTAYELAMLTGQGDSSNDTYIEAGNVVTTLLLQTDGTGLKVNSADGNYLIKVIEPLIKFDETNENNNKLENILRSIYTNVETWIKEQTAFIFPQDGVVDGYEGLEGKDNQPTDAMKLSDYKLALSRMNFVETPSEIGKYKNNFRQLDGKDYDEHGCTAEQSSTHNTGALTTGKVNSYTFRVNYANINFVKKYEFDKTVILGSDANTCSYAIGDSRYYRSVNTNVKYAVQINLKDFGMYDISPLIKKVSWPQKLMEDMQVLYPDLNWGTLIATDGWLDTLGEFTSAYASGQFISSGNSSNTTAAGLVLSEFFLSQASVTYDGYANFEYSSLFDEDVIKSLMLSLMGEENYIELSQQAVIFMEMFNSAFAPILDDIARENAYEIVDGQVDNFTMCVYKSYLATVLLSSDIGEYLYTVATRVYAQYTIYETLACATGDYAGYYAYTSGQTDEKGEVIDSFTYGSFYELVKYENMYAGNSTPVYTFSMIKAYRSYCREILSSSKSDTALNADFNNIIGNETSYKQWYNTLFNYIDNAYLSAYSNDETIPDTSDLYCFMFEAYWAMKTDCYKYTGSRVEPDYLSLYRDYLDGEIVRWSTVKDSSISNTSKYISKYQSYKQALTMSKIPMLAYLGKILFQFNYKTDDIKEVQDKISNGKTSLADYVELLVGKVVETLEANTTKNVLTRSLGYEYSKKIKWLDIVYVNRLMENSESGSNSAWLSLNEMYEDIGLLVSEVGEIKKLVVGDSSSANKTPNGSIRIFDTDEIYDAMLDQLSSYYQAIGTYISSQSMLDKITKASITYVLGQYGQNYISTGFEFNIENRNYTFNTTLSASRLAEYVYGGEFLVSVNSYPVYTSADYSGLIRRSKAYDTKDQMLKTQLEMWPELRNFASNLANYTAKIYYQTNLKDLSTNILDNVKLTDYVCKSPNDVKTIEYLILEYLLSADGELDTETLVRIMFADTVDSLTNIGTAYYKAYGGIANFLEGNNINTITGKNELPANARDTLRSYLSFVASNSYNASGKYNSGSDTSSERIHKVFKNVMSYLLVAEDKESDEENPLNLDNITFKELKLIIMDRIVEYEQNLSETAAQNSNRYLTIFDLLNCEVNYSYCDNDGESHTDRVLTYYIIKDNVGTTGLKYKEITPIVSFTTSRSTRNVVLQLAGLSNRPIAELVNLEYDKLYDRNGNYDEALGDVFVLCFYDERDGKYYPYLARGKNVDIPETSNSDDYYLAYPNFDIKTDYYNAAGNTNSSGFAYPIVAKGIINAAGQPTAIRLVDGEVKYYRTQVLATTSVDEDAVRATQTVSEVNTVGYTQTVETTSSRQVSGKSSRAMFISSFDLKSFVNTSSSVYFMQNQVLYHTEQNDFGEISVLDQFDSYYSLLDGMALPLLIMSFMSVIPIMFKATAAVLRRILDLIFFILIGPVVISMTSLDYEDKGAGKAAFDKWKTGITQALIAALGFIIGFRIYYLLVSTTLNMSFISDTTVESIQRIGSLSLKFGNSTFNLRAPLEMVVKFMFLLTSSSMIEKAGNMLLKIISGGEVQNAFASPIGGKDVLETLQEMKNEMQKSVEKFSGVVSGKAILEAKAAATERIKSMVPGSAVIGSAVGAAKDIATHRQSKQLEKQLRDKDIAKDVAKKAAKSFKDNKNKQRDLKTQTRLNRANSFMQTYMGGKKDTFKKPPNLLKDLGTGFKELGGPKKDKPKKEKRDKAPKKKKEKKK